MTGDPRSERSAVLVEEIARVASDRCVRIATAESLTGGMLAAALSAGPEAGSWYRGGVVAYHPSVKHELLGVPDVPVVSAASARSMAASAARLLRAEYALSLTGVGGPGPQDGIEPGRVYIADLAPAAAPRAVPYRFDGEPLEIMRRTIDAALAQLLEALHAGAPAE
ncbi:CinA family protein [Leucobacter allii]|uniref:CinA family protein n=1 Tax=Leucobacter allii TaxID=2932247 RepID=A0ABY4FLI2_9MICO|nr:nicotinamide-nucleotide amidohydrolase family protein [Leucobacter allii]UOQ57138.1 CinA family protein [Leucobacter allii]UOR01645.1 CinA family protein [Leucobacter allii]